MRSTVILEWVTGPDVLDVGCAGHVPEPESPYWLHGVLEKRFPGVVGIDIHEENILRLKEMGYRNLHIASAEDFKLHRKFDTIVCGELIEHLSNPKGFLLQCRRHLKPEGRIVLTTPYPFSLLYTLYAWLKFPHTCQNPEHNSWFCVSTLQTFVERCGLKTDHFELIEDYRMDNPSPRYGIFVRILRIRGPIIPMRLRGNTRLFVLTHDGQSLD